MCGHDKWSHCDNLNVLMFFYLKKPKTKHLQQALFFIVTVIQVKKNKKLIDIVETVTKVTE